MKLNFTLLVIVFTIASSYGKKASKQTQTSKDEVAIHILVTEAHGAKVNPNAAGAYTIELFDDDVLWARPDASYHIDKAGIQEGMQNTFNKFKLAVQPTVEEISVFGELAYVSGNIGVNSFQTQAETSFQLSSAFSGC